jgi:hypothetical protein
VLSQLPSSQLYGFPITFLLAGPESVMQALQTQTKPAIVAQIDQHPEMFPAAGQGSRADGRAGEQRSPRDRAAQRSAAAGETPATRRSAAPAAPCERS